MGVDYAMGEEGAFVPMDKGCRWTRCQELSSSSGEPSMSTYPSDHSYMLQQDQDTSYDECMNSKGDFISGGATGIVELLPNGYVVKSPWPRPDCRSDMETEDKVYSILGSHPRLVKKLSWNRTDFSLVMEYMPNGCLNDYVRKNNSIISDDKRLQWILEAAEGLQLLHSNNIIPSDVQPKNFLLDAELGLKIADFSGSSVNGSQASTCPGTRFRRWSEAPDKPAAKDDLFGLGSTIYMIATGVYPFEDLLSDDVSKHYANCQFPDLQSIVCRDIIERCWRYQVQSAQEVYDFVGAILDGQSAHRRHL